MLNDMNDTGKEKIAERIAELLRKRIDNDSGLAIVMKMTEAMGERAAAVADECDVMVRYDQYLTESEAKSVTAAFDNFDGSHGPRWKDPQALFVAAAQAGVKSDDEPKYNDWAFYAVMNMIWSDYWGALRQFVPQDEVRVCAELAKAALCDRDHGFNVRRYFGL